MTCHQAYTSVNLSPVARMDLQVYRGDSGIFLLDIVNQDGLPFDITDAEFLSQIRAKTEDANVICELTVSKISSSMISVDLSSADSQNLPSLSVWDLQMTLDNVVSTLVAGEVRAAKDVSRSVLPLGRAA